MRSIHTENLRYAPTAPKKSRLRVLNTEKSTGAEVCILRSGFGPTAPHAEAGICISVQTARFGNAPTAATAFPTRTKTSRFSGSATSAKPTSTSKRDFRTRQVYGNAENVAASTT